MCLKILQQETKLFLWVSAIFFSSIVVSIILAHVSPKLIYSVYNTHQLSELSRHYDSDYIALKKTVTYHVNISDVAFYLINNIGVGLQIFIAGIVIGLGPLILLVYNGISLGFLMGYIMSSGHQNNLWPTIISHSAFEILATLLAAMAGIIIGRNVITAISGERLKTMIDSFKKIMPLLLLMTVLYTLAGTIEALWSANVHIESMKKYTMGGLVWLLILSYLALCLKKPANK